MFRRLYVNGVPPVKNIEYWKYIRSLDCILYTYDWSYESQYINIIISNRTFLLEVDGRFTVILRERERETESTGLYMALMTY